MKVVLYQMPMSDLSRIIEAASAPVSPDQYSSNINLGQAIMEHFLVGATCDQSVFAVILYLYMNISLGGELPCRWRTDS